MVRFPWEGKMGEHNFCSTPKYRGWNEQLLLSLASARTSFLAFLNRLFRTRQPPKAFVLQNKLQKEYYLLTHSHAYMLRISHAYLFQFLISFLFGMIVGMNALHHIFKACSLFNHSKLFQSKHTSKWSQAVCPRLGIYCLFFLRVWMCWIKAGVRFRNLPGFQSWSSIGFFDTHQVQHQNRRFLTCFREISRDVAMLFPPFFLLSQDLEAYPSTDGILPIGSD